MNALDHFVNALKAHLVEGNPRPTCVKLPMLLALDFCKSHSGLSCAEEKGLLRHGSDYLVRLGLFGLEVEIIHDSKAVLEFE